VTEELRTSASIAQLIKIEKSIDKQNELLLCIVLQLIELNTSTKYLNYISGGTNTLLEKDVDKEFKFLMAHVKKYSEQASEIVKFKCLPKEVI
jgi:hypothetical protein